MILAKRYNSGTHALLTALTACVLVAATAAARAGSSEEATGCCHRRDGDDSGQLQGPQSCHRRRQPRAPAAHHCRRAQGVCGQ